MNITMLLSRLAIGMCGIVVGAYCAYTAFRNGQMLASGIDGIAFGSAFSAVVIGSWFLLPLAAQSPSSRAVIMRVGWALCLAFVLINAVGFTANHRTHTVGDKANAITTYNTSLKSLQEAQERLETLKANPRWVKTSGCSDATAERSIEFCRQVEETKADVTSNQSVITAGKPATTDAQADTIAWATHVDTAVVSRGLPIFMAVVLDIAASMFIWAAMTTYRVREITKPVEEPKTEAPVIRKSRKTAKPKKIKKVDWTRPEAYAHPPKLTKSGAVDQRTKSARAVKRVVATRVMA